ncbi:MAG: ribokinase [Clostridia bacterium]|nr:ribokinase [Clostridia bacterium]
MKILNFGSMNRDDVYTVDHFVQPGETLSAAALTVKAGGKGLNQSVALRRAGADVWHAGCVGTGGDMLVKLLQASGVHTELVRSVPVSQGNAVIQVNEQGENCILLFGGSNQCITEEQIIETLHAFSTGDWMLLQNEVNLVPHMVEKAAAKGLRIALNPSPFDGKLANVPIDALSWLIMNEIEAAQITDEKEPEEAWKVLHARYPRLSVLITLGALGSQAWQVTGETVESHFQHACTVKAVDTTGAGDTYTGYFLAGLMEDMPLSQCMERASRAAAIAVTRIGAADSIPWSSELEAGGEDR